MAIPFSYREGNEIDEGLFNMPLKQGKSNKTRNENIKKEIVAGKKPSQAVAIAYSVQRKARKKKK